jgi:murein DD-endopeptidase MepM/ murein hydrolase activator NlpD
VGRAKSYIMGRNGALAVVTALTAFALAPAAGASLVAARNGNLSAFSGGVSTTGGELTAVPARYGADHSVYSAAYSGPGDAAVSGSLAVDWTVGQTVAWGAAFRLAPNFHGATEGQQELMGWTAGATQEGVTVDYSDNEAYLVASPGSPLQQILVGPFTLPIGQWFTLQVRQLLGSAPSARSRVYVNNRLVGSSPATTLPAGQVSQVSYGIAQLTPPGATGPVSLEFDQAFAAVFTAYGNPFAGEHYISGRTDMGVDFCLKPGAPIRAIGDGIVIGISPDWFRQQPYLWYQLVDGPYAGRYLYVAEQITRLAHVGALLTAGQQVARYTRRGTCIETGWSAADGATLAQATTGYHEGQITRAGVAFARFLMTLGVLGRFELHPTHGTRRPVRAGMGDR